MEIDKIYLGDCLELMKDIPNKSIDMVLCDLPYGVLNRGNKNARWDNIIPFEPLWEQYERVCKDKANIVLFAGGLFTAKLMMSNPKFWRYNLIWNKEYVTGYLDANRRPLLCHEDIVIFTNGGGYANTYNPQKIKNIPHTIGGLGVKNSCYGNHKYIETRFSDEMHHRSIVNFPKEDGTRHFHPTTKPIDLLRWLIRTYSNEGEIILDNCMGSGSTCVAAIKEKRHYIGIEIMEEYYKVAKQRIDNENRQLKLF